MRRRLGFTLVELLVVIAIIGILVSLLMPAVQASREAARRLACLNNLKQLGLAVGQYESVQGKLPPAGLVDESRVLFEPRSGPMFSWIVLVLPYLDQQPLYERFDLRKSVLEQEEDPQATHLEILCCPSDRAAGRFFAHSELTGDKRFAKGNYAAYCSPFHVDLQHLFPGAIAAGGQSAAEIRDGMSNTLMLAEIRTRGHEEDPRGAWALPWNGASLLAFDMHDDPRGSGTYTPARYCFGYTQRPNCQGPNLDVLYECPDEAAAQVDGVPCAMWKEHSIWDFLSSAPRSHHPGGVNVAFADGRVTFLRNEIDEVTMAYMVSANDYQTLDLSKYFE